MPRALRRARAPTNLPAAVRARSVMGVGGIDTDQGPLLSQGPVFETTCGDAAQEREATRDGAYTNGSCLTLAEHGRRPCLTGAS